MPLYTIFITPAADKDLTAAIEYYNQQAEDLGYRFADLVEEYLNRIATTPGASAVRYRDIRCKPMRIFPYLIMFAVDESAKSVIILRFFHAMQKPSW